MEDGAEGDGSGVPGGLACGGSRTLSRPRRGAACRCVTRGMSGDEYWRNAYCTDTSCCPLPGRPVEEIRDSRLNAEMVYRGSSVGAPPGDSARCRTARRNAASSRACCTRRPSRRWAQRTVSAAGAEATGRSSASRAGRCWSPRSWAAFRASGACPWSSDPALASYLRATLRVPAWRDAVLVMAAAGRAAAARGRRGIRAVRRRRRTARRCAAERPRRCRRWRDSLP